MTSGFYRFAFDDYGFYVATGPIHRPEGPSAGRMRSAPRRWWQQPLLDDTPYVPPSSEEVEAKQREAEERRQRIQARAQQMRDEAERKEMKARAGNKRLGYDERFKNAFGLAAKDGMKWKN